MRASGLLVFWPLAWVACFSQSSGRPGDGGTFDASEDVAFDSTTPEAEASPQDAVDAPVEASPVVDAPPDVLEAASADAPPDAPSEGGPDGSADAAATADADAGGALALSPMTPTAKGCSTDLVTFTASGGTPPYTWSTSDTSSGDLLVTGATQATWKDNADNFCGVSGTVTVTVQDSAGGSSTATTTVQAG